MSIDFVILAAGNGNRMNSRLPKPFHEIAGKPIIRHIIDMCSSVKSNIYHNNRIIVVTKDEYKGSSLFNDVIVSIQKEQLGTGNAVSSSLNNIENKYVVILCSDMPLLTNSIIEDLIDSINNFDISFIAMKLKDDMMKMPYGRIILDNNKNFEKIVEYKDANENERLSQFANSGIYIIKKDVLSNLLPSINNNNSQNEFYFTDILNIAKNNGNTINVIISDDYDSFHGINNMKDLAYAERIIQNRLRDKFLSNGVKIIDPESVYFSMSTYIENDVTIEPNVIFKGEVSIKSGSIIKSFSYIEDSNIENNVKIGPFARIRGNVHMNESSEIGNFVEIKGSKIGTKTKIKHLSYIGDSNIGKNVNIGAGTITCNYDGIKKHKTNIEDNVFIGSNCSLIAPINIQYDSIVGAGSVITKDVPPRSLSISRIKQENIEEKANYIKEKIKNRSL